MGNSNSQIISNKSNIYNVIPDIPDIRDIYLDVTDIDKKIQIQKEINEAKDLNITIELENDNNDENKILKNATKKETNTKELIKKHVDLRINIDVLPIYMFSMEEIGITIPCAICSIIYAKLAAKDNTLFCPSRCFLLYNTFLKNGIIPIQNDENIEDTISNELLLKYTNQKLSIRDYLKTLKQFGICDEKNYPCNVQTLFKKPNEFCYNEGRYLQFNYKKVNNNIEHIKYLLSNDEIILCNLSIYATFMDNDTIKSGKIKMPDKKCDSHIGMIACTLVGYMEKQKHFIVRFSFGNSWGDKGYGYVPYEYAQLLINDLWIIELEIPFISLNMRVGQNYENNFSQMHNQLNPHFNNHINTNAITNANVYTNGFNPYNNHHMNMNPNSHNNYNINNYNMHNYNEQNYNRNKNSKEMIDRKKYMIGGISSL